MNLNTYTTKNEKDELMLSITKNVYTLNEQAKTTSQKTLEIKMNKPTETFSFD